MLQKPKAGGEAVLGGLEPDCLLVSKAAVRRLWKQVGGVRVLGILGVSGTWRRGLGVLGGVWAGRLSVLREGKRPELGCE